eukprot:1338873-Amphidinium_carterae.1
MWQQFPKRIYKWIRGTVLAWSASTLADIIRHCPDGKAHGADRWGMGESNFFPLLQSLTLPTSSKLENVGQWPSDL